MAGVSVGESPENPVAINVTAMVDVIFCLCVFFMCSLHFRQLEGKFETWLPKGKGTVNATVSAESLSEMRVAMFWDEAKQQTVRQFGQRFVQNDDELQSLIKSAHDDYLKLNKPDAPLTVDAMAAVPWSDVIDVVNIGKREKIDKIEFAMGASAPK
jgi:biopolymer transport protein ExbD